MNAKELAELHSDLGRLLEVESAVHRDIFVGKVDVTLLTIFLQAMSDVQVLAKMEAVVREVIIRVLTEEDWNIRKAANRLNVGPKALTQKMHELGIEEPNIKNDPDAAERAIIKEALRMTCGDVHRAARHCGISVAELRELKAKYNL